MKSPTIFPTQFTCFGVFLLLVLPVLFATRLFQGNHVIFFVLNLLSGILTWTYFEYHLHRFWTHNKNGSSKERAFQRHMHHHKHPTEIKVTSPQRLVLFSACSGLIAISIACNNSFTIFTGFAVGLAYSFFSHWILHQSWSKNVCPHLHRFHIHHHCKYPDKCFGFTTILWDLVFRTVPPKEAKITDRVIRFYYGHH